MINKHKNGRIKLSNLKLPIEYKKLYLSIKYGMQKKLPHSNIFSNLFGLINEQIKIMPVSIIVIINGMNLGSV